MTALLPPNATDLEKALEMLAAIRDGDLDVPLRDLWSAQDCPEALLPWLAWALSLDAWDANWPVNIRRARIASAIEVQRRKGTVISIRDVVASFGGIVGMTEWFDQTPPGTPHTFELLVALAGDGSGAPDPAFISQIIDEVSRTKPVRSHFTFTVAGDAQGRVGMLGVARAMTFARISADAASAPTSQLLLSGDQQTGNDVLLLSGDQQTDGDDALLLNIYS